MSQIAQQTHFFVPIANTSSLTAAEKAELVRLWKQGILLDAVINTGKETCKVLSFLLSESTTPELANVFILKNGTITGLQVV